MNLLWLFRPNTASTPILKGGNIATHTPSSASLHSAPSALYGSYIFSHGSPSTPDVSDLKSKTKNCWRTVVLNANSVVSPKKSADLASLTDYTRPDALITTETKTRSPSQITHSLKVTTHSEWTGNWGRAGRPFVSGTAILQLRSSC